ncbi:metal ABC transporter solute-binding protein, Zn/Mn family [Curtobacterium sp. ISL-83]|uniref:metal ABC transporter solute-binding protein, Zn/Mn family n=1 Tax=Curtobacterium sp. ISL-83 TaxID=2819145 RepID=UPI001BE9050A|nr:zinc ABC transporter substrate-binding protein [Curtobacterium sp. ISL-83]MBT2502564.1 zinc ABC transporter substrate-binding protein [Curtobacterium sp. ISL-83]
MRSRLLALPLVAGAAVLALAGCSTAAAPGGATTDRTVDVVASTNVYGSLVRTVGGDHVAVTSILEDPSQDPHSFESSATTQLAVSKADLLIENGGGYDDFMTSLRNASRTKAATIDVVRLSGLDTGGDASFNEHVFYDYPTMVRLVSEIERHLSTLDRADADVFAANAKSLTAKLQGLESQTAALKQQDGGEQVAYTEPVPGYLFDAIGLHNATPEAFSHAIEEGDDVPPLALHDTLALFTGGKVRLLAVNDQATSPQTELVQKAAERAGVPVIGVTETLPAGKDYVSWQQANIDAVRTALAK